MLQRIISSIGQTRATLACAVLLLASAPAWAVTTHRSVMDFVNAQGQVSYGPPGTQQIPGVADFVGFTDTKRDRGVSADYAGLADEALDGALGTTFAGDITERDVAGGRILVHVVLHTNNELVWVIPFDPSNTSNQFGDNPLLFGARPADLFLGAEPAIGSSTLTLDFLTNKRGAPLPDLEYLAFQTNDLLSVRFVAEADGFFANGSPGKVQVTQVGIFNNGFHGAVGDGFPAESINLIKE